MTSTPQGAPGPACTRLAGSLRELRGRTGLSMAALAERTPYSKSSWERYLNGKLLAPRSAVEALCRLADEPPGRLVALWELADLEWSGRSQGATRPLAGTVGAQPDDARQGRRGERGDHDTSGDRDPRGSGSGRWGRRQWAVAAAVCVVGVAAAVWAATLPGTGDERPTAGTTHTAAPAVGCHAQGCAGKEPGTMGCGSAVRDLGASRRMSTGAWVEIRYNAACGAAWARMWHTTIGDRLVVSAPGSKPQRAEVTDRIDAGDYVFTYMVDADDRAHVRACFEPARGGEECFHG
ncbi:XRE family transcriptional regulator [Streptomyces sp. TS71-3]|uniref:helix-turn-helix domain-containing protein n=1 Tax=Streptomyces sp. TS71-3 TaxID=2733862 RepID=UPI001B031A2B|nr:XRE family transcriptional regulator [Streptomyces sp. TS71-3]GHJ36129.1 hypothetical protein Sm713_17380 [Streptomyces sp. TS71-3]